ncbi:Clp protease N-terminal domain-containing protein [Streptomyces xinghaiensis]|uniref:Clp protease N-terminal domain-containing protein n=1 Tax=Streptomyces xinghaiensis TaxID=1038928 RepID=UPI0037B2EEBB
MGAIKEPDWSIVGVLGSARGARGATDAEAIGTEHLLAGVTTAKGAARQALADEGATKVAVAQVLRNRGDRDGAWSVADDPEGSVTSQDLLGDDGDKGIRFTGAAARALTAAMGRAQREGAAKFGADHLLRALLEEDNRAVELLAACGVAPQAVRARLDGGTGSRDDGLAPLLHPTRDVLLGRGHYRQMPFWKRWVVRYGGMNWATMPFEWVRYETLEQARRLGHRVVGTEHVLLAVLATHEVVLRYPHMAGESTPAAGTRYAGGERLARLGVDHASVHSALTGDRVRLTADPRPFGQYIDESAGRSAVRQVDSCSGSAADPGTGPLVEVLLKEETRARRLTDALTVTAGD